MSGNEIVAVISVFLCLVLAWGSLKSHALSTNTKLQMTAIWLAIFLGGVAIVSWMQG
jgi:hypothetical protein